jgi:CRP/FNR family transcriptional regulator, cyclic AMP receptor protein
MTHDPGERWLLQRFGLLEPLSDLQRVRLAAQARLMTLEHGRRVYGPGDRSEHVYLVGMGLVGLAAPQDGWLPLTFLYPGEIFGEMALFGDARRDHGADVQHDAVICALPAVPVRELMHVNAEFARQVGRLLAARLRALQTHVAELLHPGARARVAHVLLTLAGRFGSRVGDAILVPVGLRQQDLAALAGVRRETANGILRDFSRLGIARMTRREIRLTDPAALEAALVERCDRGHTTTGSSFMTPDPFSIAVDATGDPTARKTA